MCLFRSSSRKAASVFAPSSSLSTRMRGMLLRSRHAGEVA